MARSCTLTPPFSSAPALAPCNTHPPKTPLYHSVCVSCSAHLTRRLTPRFTRPTQQAAWERRKGEDTACTNARTTARCPMAVLQCNAVSPSLSSASVDAPARVRNASLRHSRTQASARKQRRERQQRREGQSRESSSRYERSGRSQDGREGARNTMRQKRLDGSFMSTQCRTHQRRAALAVPGVDFGGKQKQ